MAPSGPADLRVSSKISYARAPLMGIGRPNSRFTYHNRALLRRKAICRVSGRVCVGGGVGGRWGATFVFSSESPVRRILLDIPMRSPTDVDTDQGAETRSTHRDVATYFATAIALMRRWFPGFAHILCVLSFELDKGGLSLPNTPPLVRPLFRMPLFRTPLVRPLVRKPLFTGSKFQKVRATTIIPHRLHNTSFILHSTDALSLRLFRRPARRASRPVTIRRAAGAARMLRFSGSPHFGAANGITEVGRPAQRSPYASETSPPGRRLVVLGFHMQSSAVYH